MGFPATENNIYFRDTTAKCIKVATHVTFDEAGYTIPKSSLTQTQRRLQKAGISCEDNDPKEPAEAPSTEQHHDDNIRVQDAQNIIKVQLLSPNATLLVRATPEAHLFPDSLQKWSLAEPSDRGESGYNR